MRSWSICRLSEPLNLQLENFTGAYASCAHEENDNATVQKIIILDFSYRTTEREVSVNAHLSVWADSNRGVDCCPLNLCFQMMLARSRYNNFPLFFFFKKMNSSR